MPTLVYKRTHNGDPDSLGRFGIRDCMGGVRSWAFDSVIGVGGQGAKAESNDIARKLNWIGVGAHKTYLLGMDDPVVTFDQFRDFGTDGPLLQSIAPNLARRIYEKRARAVMDFTPLELGRSKGFSRWWLATVNRQRFWRKRRPSSGGAAVGEMSACAEDWRRSCRSETTTG